MLKHRPRLAAAAASLALLGLGTSSRNADSVAAPATTAAAPPPVAAPMTAAQVLQALDQTVDWYRTLGIQQQAANEPSDLLILYDNRQTANKVMALAFEIARADAELLGKQPAIADDSGGDANLSAQALAQLQKKLESQVIAIQAELEVQQRALRTASKQSKPDVQAKINELRGELDLVNTKMSILATMNDFAAAAGGGGGSLTAQIDAMALAIPAASAAGSAPLATAASGNSPAAAPLLGPAGTAASGVDRFGLWDLAKNAFRLSEKAITITAIDRRTAELQATLTQYRAPLIAGIKALSARGDALAARADSADSATLYGVRAQLDALVQQIKQSSLLVIPSSQEGILLNHYRRNLSSWHAAIKSQYRDVLETLAIRLGLVLAVLALLFGAAELWRRTVLRYIQDTRRRYQLLLLRRIALWALVVIVIGIAFASELGSIATFAGLLTAGVAVAMQSVLVSIVGYFFLIGKYGIRVGDRIQIGDVAGEVIDLGLVRMYLMELGAKGTLGPTGRVVGFANSVVFQVASGLFKQIPGVNFRWREITLNLPPAADYAAVKTKLAAAMTSALEDYRGEILRQTKEIERTTRSSSGGDAQPQVQLHFSGGGVEAHIRYPVNLGHAAEIDERVTEALAMVVSQAAADAAAASGAGAGVPTRAG
jgi:small-conductance mechanosensitive channel